MAENLKRYQLSSSARVYSVMIAVLILVFVKLGYFSMTYAEDETRTELPIEKTARLAPLRIGEQAPDFKLPTSDGQTVTLSEFKGKKEVVLYFYPKDNTPGCTLEAEEFRNHMSAFKQAGAEVFGISVDSPKSHKFFAEKLKLNFPLLADVDGQVSRQYGVMGWIMARRVTYVIDKSGKVKQVFTDGNPKGHAKKVLSFVQNPDSPLKALAEQTESKPAATAPAGTAARPR